MNLSDYNYDLPDELIADRPPIERGTSNLLVLNRNTQTIEKKKYFNIVDELEAGDCLVINDTKVIKARLIAKKDSGVERELVIVENHGQKDNWFTHNVIYRGKIKTGDNLWVGKNKLEVLEVIGDGIAKIKSERSLLDLANEFGEPPLPPYMNRRADETDIERYQTIFAQNNGSVAAPTASLNMTDATLEKLVQKGVKIVHLTLHVGLGTFLPIRTDKIENHKMHKEYFEISPETLAAIIETKQNGGKVVALGTTVTRTLEYTGDFINELIDLIDLTKIDGMPTDDEQVELMDETTCMYQNQPASEEDSAFCQILPDEKLNRQKDLVIKKVSKLLNNYELLHQMPDGGISGEADIFIYPGYKFKIVDCLITNFHAPKSTVLMMASAFAGWEFLMQAYEFAVKEKMSFLSYGDSMIIK